MPHKLLYLLGIVFFLSLMPARGISQTPDNADTPQAELAPHKNVVKKAWTGTKRDVSKGAKATAHATTKAVNSTEHAVSKGAKATAHATTKAARSTGHAIGKGAKATAHATTKAWHGTKRAAGTAVRAPGKAIHKAKVKHEVHEEQKAAEKQ